MSPSTTSSQTSTTAAAVVWLRSKAPTETPRAPYRATDTIRPAATVAVWPVRWTSTSLAYNHGTATASDTTSDSTPISAPVAACAPSLARTTSRRRGVARNVVVIVWWRYSPAMPRIPSIIASVVMMDAGAPTTCMSVSGPSGPLSPWPAALHTATVTSAAITGAASAPATITG